MGNRWFASQVRINMIAGVGATVVQVGAVVVSYPIYLFFLGAERYGVWLVLATVLQFARLGDLGISQAIVKLVAEECGGDDREGIPEYFVAALALLLFTGTVAVGSVLLFAPQVIGVFRLVGVNARLATRLLPYVALLSFYAIIVEAMVAVLSGLGRMDLANLARATGQLVGVVVAALLLIAGWGIEALLAGAFASCALAHLLAVFFARRLLHGPLLSGRLVPRWRQVARILRFASGLFTSSMLNLLIHPFNKVLLCRYTGAASLPIYQIAFQGALQIRSLAEVPLRALMPEVSRVASTASARSIARIESLTGRALRVILAIGLPCYSLLVVFLVPLLHVWLGSPYARPVAPVLMIMLIGSYLSLLNVPAYYTLLGMGHVRAVMYSTLAKVFVNASVCLAVAHVVGQLSPLAVAYSVTAAIAVQTALLLVHQQHALVIARGHKNEPLEPRGWQPVVSQQGSALTVEHRVLCK